MARTRLQKLRRRWFEILEPAAGGDRASLISDVVLIALIILNALAFVLGTVDEIALEYQAGLDFVLYVSVVVFSAEYVTRVWVCVEHPLRRDGHPVWSRLRYIVTPMALIDLIAILPFYVGPGSGVDLRILRVLSMLRFLRIARYSSAFQLFGRVLSREGRSLMGVLLILTALLLIAASGMYAIEGHVQPEEFGDIPSAMWWAMATLTTIGYGDVIPATALGKWFAGLIMIFGVGIFALPIGILSNGFAMEVNRRNFVVTWNMISKVDLFSKLDAGEIAEIMELLRSRHLPKGTTIVREGDVTDAMYFIVSGEVVVKTGGQTLRLSTGEHFGETALLAKDLNMLSAKTATVCDLLELDAQDFNYLLLQNKQLELDFRAIAKERLQTQ
ncbi:cyclic nucleotide-gated ion channel [Maritalea sp.]|jgi:voltage-gated potassium channel|uniref:cyclic nucleotide-gated ion channel n=1 Tax=Maritalea sp. TaxID=2003361 RepID=UPI0039E36D0E